MPAKIADVKLTIRDVIRANWTNTGLPEALESTDIHTGWFDDGKGFPQVSVSNNEDGAVGGGTTGYAGIKSDGSGGTQLRSGIVLVTAWGGSREDYANAGEEQLQAEKMANRIEEIVGANQAPGDLSSLSVDRRTQLIDTEASPVEHAIQFALRYTWQKTP